MRTAPKIPVFKLVYITKFAQFSKFFPRLCSGESFFGKHSNRRKGIGACTGNRLFEKLTDLCYCRENEKSGVTMKIGTLSHSFTLRQQLLDVQLTCTTTDTEPVFGDLLRSQKSIPSLAESIHRLHKRLQIRAVLF